MAAPANTKTPAASMPAAPLPNAATLVHGAILDMLARKAPTAPTAARKQEKRA